MVVNLKPKLCAAGKTLREQIDDSFLDRDRSSDGWIGDSRHSARVSDHNPDANGWVRAIDIDKDLRSHKSAAFDLADQLRICAKTDKRIKYIIFNKNIASQKSKFEWKPYTGLNPHEHHIHISFTELGDNSIARFDIPMLGGKGESGESNESVPVLQSCALCGCNKHVSR